MRIGVLGLAVLAAACTPAVNDQLIEQTENAIRENLASQGTVKQVELNRESDNRMTGYALVEPSGAPGTEVRYNCTAQRQGETGGQFNWNCSPGGAPGAGSSQAAGGSEDGKDPQAGGASAAAGGTGVTRTALAGRWTDTGNCSEVTLLAEDGTFIAPNGGRGQWSVEGSQLVLTGPGGRAAFQVSLADPNTMQLVNEQGQPSQSTRC